MSEIVLSICIVTFQAGDYLRKCLESILAFPPSGAYEIIVVDNASTDGTQAMLKQEFPQVQLICNPENWGYTLPMNQALRQSRGTYAMQLNPDTILQSNALDVLIQFMEANPKAGICGPKVLNADGSMQKSCRRGESRPLAVIGYFTPLGRLFPGNHALNEYHLNYLSPDLTHTVAGVAGSCMLIRRQLINQIGYLDERIFAYQEDADYCFRARAAGWQVFYHPAAQIIHYGGQGGSRVEPWRSIWAWHMSYLYYYRKNLARDDFFLVRWCLYLLILLKLISAIVVNIFRSKKFPGPPRRI